MGGVIATYLGLHDYTRYDDLLVFGAHVTPGFRNQHRKFINPDDIPGHHIHPDYPRPKEIETHSDHMTTLDQLGFTSMEEKNHVITTFESGLADPLNFPLMAGDLKNLPPAYVLACEYDTLRDDALLYAHRLQQAGNSVVLDHQMQGWHGYILFSQAQLKVTSAIHAFNNITQFIRQQASSQ